MGTNDGLFKFNISTEGFTQYTAKDGIQGNEFDIHARFKDDEGQIFMGGIYGVTYFSPDDLEGIDKPHQLYFTDLILKGNKTSRKEAEKHLDAKSISSSSELKIWKNDFPFNLSFSSIDFDHHSNYDFAYRLLPSNIEWTFLDRNERQIQFISLPPGKKQLEITAFSRGIQWTTKPLVIKLNVVPVWWKRWWALLLFSMIAFLIVRKMYQYQLARNAIVGEHQRLKDLDEMKNNFYANISHEFRTPLTIIMGMLENLKGANLAPQTNKDVSLIEKNSKKLLKLVNDILGLAKLENSSISLNLTKDNVIPVISYCVESMQALATSKNIDLVFYPEIEFIEMDFDAERLSSIVTNLISNAIKFTREEGKVFVHAHKQTKNGIESLSIKVKDNGLGIPEQDLPHIFKKYFQSSFKHDILEKGTGIGLALTKELLRAMNGNIGVESKVDQGTTFSILIPISRNAEKEIIDFFVDENFKDIQNKVAPIEAEFNTDQPLVLLVEDHADVASYIINCLTNFNVILANNGRKGIEMAESHIPYIVISDIIMPKVSGFELCQHLKSNFKTDHIPIILLSAKAEESDKILGFEKGADAYITKPFSKVELLSRIKQLLNSRNKLLNKVKSQGIESLIREKHTNPNLKFLQKAVSIIHDNLDNTLFGPPLFAEKMGMSESQLYKKLKATSGKSTALFIRSIKLEKAKMILLSTNKTISQVTYEIGFNDPSWFSRTFKLEFGYAPSEIKKHHKKDANN